MAARAPPARPGPEPGATVYRGWLEEPTPGFRAGVTRPALDPFRGYANALRDALPDAAPVLDPFHVVKLGSQMLDEVRRRSNRRPSATEDTSPTRSTASATCSAMARNT